MKKSLIAAAILAALSSNQVIADDVSGSARYDLHKSELIVPCVLVNDPDGPLDGKHFDVTLSQRGESLNFEVTIAEEESDAAACLAAAELLYASDEDTTDEPPAEAPVDEPPEDEPSSNEPSTDGLMFM